ncbi:hypothetical protein B9G55_18625 [Saccharibacillus sp. O16]|nr:hypothetical protein B9G55_18625 [Saccharibacillus sp. O16]
MSQIANQQVAERLRSLPDGSPDYDKMWNRICLEVERRRSGWNEQTGVAEHQTSASSVRRWMMAASAAAVLAIAGGTTAYFMHNLNNEAVAPAAPAGQQIEASAQVGEVKLTLRNAVIGRRFFDEEDRLALQLNLSGLNNRPFDYAAFRKGTLTDLDSGQNISLTSMGFDARKGIDNLNVTQYVQDNLPAAGEKRHYRLVMNDLYLTGRSEVPLNGEIKQGQTYNVLPEQNLKIKLTSYEWLSNQTKLNVAYQAMGTEPLPQDYDPAGGYEGSSYLTLKNGDQTIPLSSSMADDQGKLESFMLQDLKLTEQERKNLRLVYSYAETVDKIEGEWTIDFTVEASKAATQTYSISLNDQQAFEDRTAMKISPMKVSPFGVEIPIVRQHPNSTWENGQFLYYGKMTLEGDGIQAMGIQRPLPTNKEARDRLLTSPSQLIYFELGDDQIQDLSGQPLTLKLRDAMLYHKYPEVWTPISAPQAKAGDHTKDTMPDGSVMDYQVTRIGEDDVQVQVRGQGQFELISGMLLQVDGRSYKPNAERSEIAEEGDRVIFTEVFENVPQGSNFSINPGAYGVHDPSRDLNMELQAGETPKS